MQNIIIDIMFYTIQAFIFWGYCHYALVTNAKKRLTLPLTLLFFYVMLAFRQLFIDSLYIVIVNTFFVLLCFFVCLLTVYRQPLMSALITALSHYLFVLIAENITLPLLAVFYGNDYRFFQKSTFHYILMQIIVKLIYAVLSLLFAREYKKYNQVKDNTGYVLLFVIAGSNTVIFLLIDLFSQLNNQDISTYIVWAVCSFFLYVALYLVFYYRNYMLEQAQKINALAQKEFDEKYYQMVDASNQNLQVLSHDFKNHLIQIENADSLEQVRSYVADLYPAVRSFHAVSVSRNKALNLLVSKYNTLCAVQGVDFSYRITGTDLSFLEAADLTSLLGNLLDNALEAAAKSSEKKMELDIFLKNNTTAVVSIQNAAESAPQTENWALKSTKKQADLHGFGLQSVQNTVKKYGGFYEWDYGAEKKRFTTTVSFYMKEE